MLEAIGTIILIVAIVIAVWDANNGFVVRWRRLGILAALILGIAFLGSPAKSQHVHPDETISDPRVAKFYEGWHRPPRRVVSCCNMQDCYSAQIRRSKTGGLEYLHKWSGTWAAIPPEVLEENQKDALDSPSTENHVCANPVYPELVYCAVRAGGY